MGALTTVQHSALCDLQRFGALYPCVGRAERGTMHGFSGRTLAALVDAGHARWDVIYDRTGAGETRWSGIVPADAVGSPVIIGGGPVCEVADCTHEIPPGAVARGHRVCLVHYVADGEIVTGPVTIDGMTPPVLAVYNPRDRWNGWLAAPRFDAWSAVTVLDSIDRDGASITYAFTDTGALALTDHNAYGTEDVIHPDQDGLYDLGLGWVWSEDDETGEDQ